MTIGYSRTVKDFLTKAALKRSFQVIVAETSPT
jgi:translation initiation factor 2B subunit (eIF-2B alpha/beta/delta family)